MSTKKATNFDQLKLLAQRTATEVQALDQKIGNITVPEYTVKKQDSAETGYLATYQLFKETGSGESKTSTAVGEKINIPKDFLVKSGEVKTVTTADDPYEGAKVGDKYIDFVINVKSGSATDEHMYLPVNELVDAYTGDNKGVVLGAGNVFSLKIKSGSGLSAADDGLDLAAATQAAQGAMSAADKTKLDGIAAGATKTEASDTEGAIKVNGADVTVVEFATDAEVTAMLNEVFGDSSSNT